MTFIGIDNGSNATIGIVNTGLVEPRLMKVPVKLEQSFTKKKQNVSRLDHRKFEDIMTSYMFAECAVLIEQPMVQKFLFTASLSAVRMMEAQLVILEQLKIKYKFVYSKDWQKTMLKASEAEDTKAASFEVGNALFPQFKDFKHKDRDGLLIAEYAKRLWTQQPHPLSV